MSSITNTRKITKRMLCIPLNVVLLGIWLWLFHPIYPYLRTIFTRQEFRTNQIVLLVVVALIGLQLRKGSFRPNPRALPRLYLPALLMALVGPAAFVLARQKLDINTLSATLFGLATYGFIGLWLRPEYWRRGLPAALLLVGALPFGEHLDTFVGYPLRIVTASLVSRGLASLHVQNLGVDAILVFENGITQVDSPCSGVKSLWTGGLFFLAATWIEARPINRRWLLAAIVFAFLLLVANLARVTLLVFVGQALNLRLLAEMLHVPLGVIGFVAACSIGLLLLRWAGSSSKTVLHQSDSPQLHPAYPSPFWLAPALALALLALALFFTSPPAPASASSQLIWELPAGLVANQWPLTPGEWSWLTQESRDVTASRWRFEWRGLQGSLLFVESVDWRAHHHPERCFTVYGLEVQSSQADLVDPNFPVRLLTLGLSDQPSVYSAAYWLQSVDRVTGDYAARIWDDLAPHPQPWVLITVLFDKPTDLQSNDASALFDALRKSIQSSLAARKIQER
jgi:exosortase O